MTSSQKPKKNRHYGIYRCEFDGCSKEFTRKDHLLRHQRVHKPEEKIRCSFPGCDLTFTRKDIQLKHFKRRHQGPEAAAWAVDSKVIDDSGPIGVHEVEQAIQRQKESSIRALTSSEPQTALQPQTALLPGVQTQTPTSTGLQMAPGLDPAIQSHQQLGSSHLGATQLGVQSQASVSYIPQHQAAPEAIAAPNASEAVPSPGTQQFYQSTMLPSATFTSALFTPAPLDPDAFSMSKNAFKDISPSNLTPFLYFEETYAAQMGADFSQGYSMSVGPQVDVSPTTSLEMLLTESPDFPHANNRKSVNENIRQHLMRLLPSLRENPDFSVAHIESCLEVYWLIYHPQYPILHWPSFSNQEAHPLLLLAMIMVGAGLLSCMRSNSPQLPAFANPQGLADEIAEPLRWLIFADSDCNPPAKVWVVQSLLLLDSFEITSTSRKLHERAYMHHGVKIQLLRRSPILGGDPLKEEEDDDDGPSHVWKKWVESESMKRATLMAFYLDTVHATVYGHEIVLYAHQIKISLPCDDELWEFDNTSHKIDTLQSQRPPKFLAALRRLLNKQEVNTSNFGKKILLAGLLTIMFQMQQKDLQLSFLEWNQMRDSWNETMSLAIDVWRTDICKKGCCSTENSLRFSEEDLAKLPPMLRLSDRRCKYGIYHIAQIYMRITHYDYIIYAGAPRRMNVTVGKPEYAAVERRVKKWANSASGRVSVVHAYMFLCEMLLDPENEDVTLRYDPNVDPFLHRKNIVVSAVLVVFAYNYCLYGPEQDLFQMHDSVESGSHYPAAEGGYAYLKRIRALLDFNMPGTPTSYEYHTKVNIAAENMLSVPNSNRIVGLLKIFYKSFRNCNWEVGREYSKLIKNCVERSLGKRKITCDDMYMDNERRGSSEGGQEAGR